MNPYLIQNLVDSLTFFLLLFVGLLLLAVVALITQVNRKNQVTRETDLNLKMLESVFRNASVPAIIIDEKGECVLANNEAAKLYKTSIEEMENEYFEPFTLIANSRVRQADLSKQLRENERYSFKSIIITPEKNIPCEFAIFNLLSGDVTRYLVGITPIEQSERTRHEQNLLEAKINEVEKAAGIGFWTYDFSTRGVSWSRGLYDLLGKEIHKTVPDFSFLSQYSRESSQSAQNMMMAIKNQEPFEDRIVLEDESGRKRMIDVTLRHQEGLGINERKTIGIMREVTDDQDLVEDLSYSSRLWKALGQREDLAIVVTDREGKVVFANNAITKLANMPLDNMKEYKAVELFGQQEIPPTNLITSKPLTYTSSKDPYDNTEVIILWSSIALRKNGTLFLNISIGVNLTKSVENLSLIKSQYSS